MTDTLTLGNLFDLLTLILLQAVLGFDNLLYISLESKRVPEPRQAFVRKMGIGLAIGLRLILLLVLMVAFEYLDRPFLNLAFEGIATGNFNLQSVVVIVGGVFILYTAMKEIMHMLSIEELGHGEESKRSVARAIFWIVLMNLVFSFDSILSALALTKIYWIMATAIIISGILMIWLAEYVAEFLKRNRMYEVLGLFVLFIVGIMLLSEGAHNAHLTLFGHEIHPMAKSTFYFTIGVLALIDVVQSRYQKKLILKRKRAAEYTT